MLRQVVAPAALLAVMATVSASAAWTPPLLPAIAKQATGETMSVRCLTAAEWSAAKLLPGSIAARRGRTVLVAEQACSVIVGYASSFPHAPKPGTPQELDVTRSLYHFLAAAVSKLGLSRLLADCRTLKAFVPALLTLGVPSKSYAMNVRKRLLVARKRLHIAITVSKACSVQLPPAAPA
jgi:hypothetical protein